jgi:hypothetical protein
MQQWFKLRQIVDEVHFKEESDCIVWQYNSLGKYLVQILYAVINNREVRQVYTPLVWKLSVPSWLHIFFWLFAKNKVLTRDNLAKRKKLDNMSCLFCIESESVSHLFFDCCVARVTWEHISEVCGKEIGTDFESVANMWLHDKKIKTINICTTATLWAI